MKLQDAAGLHGRDSSRRSRRSELFAPLVGVAAPKVSASYCNFDEGYVEHGYLMPDGRCSMMR